MTRRIALSVLALITVLLVLAVVPLGLSLAQRERTSFRDAAEADDRSIGSTAEEHLSDHKSEAPLLQLLSRTGRKGECAAVFDTSGRRIAGTPCTASEAPTATRLVQRVLASPYTRSTEGARTLTVAVPIGEGPDDTTGVAVLIRSADPLHNRILAMWGRLVLVGLAGLLAAVLLSSALARWVSRPLLAVDAAAQRLGEGALEERAPVARGPQEVRRLAATFNTMAGRTEALIHGHRTVIADVSHQLRTPLTALRLRLDVLSTDAEDDTAAELAGAQEEIARLSRLVDGLLAVARAESAVPRPVPVAVDEVVAERVAAWEPLATERGVTLSARCPSGATAHLGGGHLEQVLDNLLANALDAVPEGGRVEIAGTVSPGTVRLTVADDGPGMAPAARAAAFRRFGNPDARGSGLGLAIVHRLVTANGGAVRLEDAPQGGLSVVLDLPTRFRTRLQ